IRLQLPPIGVPRNIDIVMFGGGDAAVSVASSSPSWDVGKLFDVHDLTATVPENDWVFIWCGGGAGLAPPVDLRLPPHAHDNTAASTPPASTKVPGTTLISNRILPFLTQESIDAQPSPGRCRRGRVHRRGIRCAGAESVAWGARRSGRCAGA